MQRVVLSYFNVLYRTIYTVSSFSMFFYVFLLYVLHICIHMQRKAQENENECNICSKVLKAFETHWKSGLLREGAGQSQRLLLHAGAATLVCDATCACDEEVDSKSGLDPCYLSWIFLYSSNNTQQSKNIYMHLYIIYIYILEIRLIFFNLLCIIPSHFVEMFLTYYCDTWSVCRTYNQLCINMCNMV